MSGSLQPRGLQTARLPCPSLSPRVCSNWCLLSQRCHPTISFCHPHRSCPQFFPASGSFLISWLFTSRGQSMGASASVLPMNIQEWCPLGLTGLIFSLSKGLSWVPPESLAIVSRTPAANRVQSIFLSSHILEAPNLMAVSHILRTQHETSFHLWERKNQYLFCPWDSPRIQEWVAIPFSRGSSWFRDWTCISCTAGRFFTIWATREALRKEGTNWNFILVSGTGTTDRDQGKPTLGRILTLCGLLLVFPGCCLEAPEHVGGSVGLILVPRNCKEGKIIFPPPFKVAKTPFFSRAPFNGWAHLG